MMVFVFTVGTLLYLVLGAAIDSVVPGSNLLGLGFQGLVFSTICLFAALWLAVRLDLHNR